MQFLRTLLWMLLAAVVVAFAFGNWTVVTLTLWGGLRLDAKLPVLLFLAFFAGFAPTALYLGAKRWRLRRRLDAAERALAELRAAGMAAAPAPLADAPRPIEPLAAGG